MCGISGALFRQGAAPRAAVERMNDRQRLRGPDSEGVWEDRGAGLCLGHRRLSIIDLDERANQPLVSADGKFAIVFNGEIYNYRELRQDLIDRGAQLRTESDTEVLLELFRRDGPAMLQRLKGMFAFGVWDCEKAELLLARDPYGIKPLYLARSDKGVLFASQVKALLASGAVSSDPEPFAAAAFLLWGSVPEPLSLYRDIRPVPPGCWQTVSRSGIGDPVSFADLSAAWDRQSGPKDDFVAMGHAALRESMDRHLVADVPIAVFLSGGVDSSVVAAMAAERNANVECFTITYPEFEGQAVDEAPRAAAIAKHFGLAHRVRTVTEAEFLSDLPAILDAMDQPTIDGVNSWFASKAVAEAGYKVVLSGVGGDELVCGYSTFKTLPRLQSLGSHLPRSGVSGRLLSALLENASERFGKPKLAALAELSGTIGGAYFLLRGLMLPRDLEAILGVKLSASDIAALINPMGASDAGGMLAATARLESMNYLRNQLLRDSDWASMAHSLELRTPLVDWTLLQSLAPHLGQMSALGGKKLLATAPRQALPAAVWSGKKTGFSVPMTQWLKRVAPPENVPSTMRSPWARRWAHHVAEAFDLPRVWANSPPRAAA